MSTGQDPGTVPCKSFVYVWIEADLVRLSPTAAPPADAPPSYDASEQSKNPDGPPGPAVQPGAPPQVPYVTNVPFAGGYPMMMPQQPGGQQPVQYVVSTINHILQTSLCICSVFARLLLHPCILQQLFFRSQNTLALTVSWLMR